MARHEVSRILVRAEMQINHLVRLIEAATGSLIVLDVPNPVAVLSSAANLKLLKYYAERAGKVLQVQTQVPELQILLSQQGIELVRVEKDESAHEKVFSPKWYHLIAIPLLIAVLAYVAYYSPEPVKITVVPEVSPYEAQFVIPWSELTTTRITTTFTITDELATSGRRVEAISAASGRVILVNDGAKAVKVPQGTVVSTAGDIRYLTLSPVTVPPRSTEYFHDIPVGVRAGQVEVRVQAVTSGTGSNIAANRVTKVLDFDVLKVVNPEPITGGEDRQLAVVTQSDFESLQRRLREQAATQVKSELQFGIQQEQVMLPETLTWELAQAQLTPEVGEQAGSIQGKAVITGEIDVVSIDSLKEQANRLAQANLAAHSTNAQISAVDLQVQSIGIEGVVCDITGQLFPVLSSAELTRLVAGQPLEEASARLKAVAGIRAVEIDAGDRNRLPRRQQFIQMVIATESEAVPASGV